MTRQEFLDGLSQALTGEVPEQTILDQLQYYRAYIDGQTASGRSEAEVLEELGNPRLIARTIIDSEEAREEQEQGAYGSQSADAQGAYQQSAYTQQGRADQSGHGSLFGSGNDQTMRVILILIAIVLVLICVLGTVFRFLFSPGGIVFLLVVVLYGWFVRKNR